MGIATLCWAIWKTRNIIWWESRFCVGQKTQNKVCFEGKHVMLVHRMMMLVAGVQSFWGWREITTRMTLMIPLATPDVDPHDSNGNA